MQLVYSCFTFDINVIILSQAFPGPLFIPQADKYCRAWMTTTSLSKECFQVDNLNENVMKVWIKASTPDIVNTIVMKFNLPSQ